MTDHPIDRPVFVVGCGRSGTTLLYEILCGHPDLAWVSTYSGRWPAVRPLAAAGRVYPVLRRRGLRLPGAPLPSEGYLLWDALRPADRRHDRRPLTEKDLAPGEAERAHRFVADHMRFMGRPRFVNKNTRNVRRIRYLDGMFPGALFVHVLRDPRAATASLLKVPWWPDLPLWCFDHRTPRQLVAAGHRPEAVAAEFWVNEVEVALDHSQAVPGRYLEVRYEDLVARPDSVVEATLEFVQLTATEGFERCRLAVPVRDSNVKFAAQLGPDAVAETERIAGPLARSLGYDLPA